MREGRAARTFFLLVIIAIVGHLVARMHDWRFFGPPIIDHLRNDQPLLSFGIDVAWTAILWWVIFLLGQQVVRKIGHLISERRAKDKK
jgi:hypothetical protein